MHPLGLELTGSLNHDPPNDENGPFLPDCADVHRSETGIFAPLTPIVMRVTTKCSAMVARSHHRVAGALSIVTSRMWFVLL